MSCVFRKKSKRKNTKRKLVGVCRGEKCVYERKCKGKNTCRVFLRRKASRKTQNRNWSLGFGGGKKLGVGGRKQAEKTIPEAHRWVVERGI